MHAATTYKLNSPLYEQETLKGRSLLNDWINTGSVGVYLFFVISGFILSLPFARHYQLNVPAVSLGRYFRKRLTRLEPPYLITLSLLLIGHFILSTLPPVDLFKHYLASFFYLHNVIYDTWSPINPVAWSLEIEIQFYILVPVLTLLFAIPHTAVRRTLIASLIAFFALLPFWWKAPFGTLPGFLQYFLTGFLVTDFYIYPPIKNPTNSSKQAFDLIGLLTIPLIFMAEYWKIRYLLPPILFLLFLAVFYGGFVRRIFSNSWIATIGGMCYITYLIHFGFFFILTKFTQHLSTGISYELDLLIQYAILLPIGLVVFAIAFLLLEKPFMYSDWPEQLWKKLKIRFKFKRSQEIEIENPPLHRQQAIETRRNPHNH